MADDRNDDPKKRRQQDELVEQLPDETDAAQERGERVKTGKDVANVGHDDKSDSHRESESGPAEWDADRAGGAKR